MRGLPAAAPVSLERMPWNETDLLRFQEAGKYLTHLNTLSAGSIVVLATFADKFHNRGPGWLLAIAALGFAFAIAASLVAYYALTRILQFTAAEMRAGEYFWFGGIYGVGFKVAGFLFVLALFCLALFAAIAVT